MRYSRLTCDNLTFHYRDYLYGEHYCFILHFEQGNSFTFSFPYLIRSEMKQQITSTYSLVEIPIKSDQRKKIQIL